MVGFIKRGDGRMLRRIGGAIIGIVVWGIVVSVLNLGLRHGWPAYAAVEKAMLFTVPMMAARLSISGISSLVGGFAAAAIGRSGQAALIAGVLLLLIFLPIHYTIWSKFPIWYHLTFLVSLPLLSLVGGQVSRPRTALT
jgi:hypothetical protein